MEYPPFCSILQYPVICLFLCVYHLWSFEHKLLNIWCKRNISQKLINSKKVYKNKQATFVCFICLSQILILLLLWEFSHTMNGKYTAPNLCRSSSRRLQSCLIVRASTPLSLLLCLECFCAARSWWSLPQSCLNCMRCLLVWCHPFY